MNSPEDFVLLSPIVQEEEGGGGVLGGLKLADAGEEGLKDYTCFTARTHWYFCSRCGVRCFAFMGHGEIRDVSYRDEEGEEKRVRGWTPKREGWREGTENGCYLSFNAATLEPGQEGERGDLRVWHEKGWISYLDQLNEVEEDRIGRPCQGGMY